MPGLTIRTLLGLALAISAAGPVVASREDAVTRDVLRSCAAFSDDDIRQLDDLDSSISMTWLLDVYTGEEPSIKVVYINRPRVDAFGGAFGRMARSIVAAKQREGMLRELKVLKARLESAWRDAQPTDSRHHRGIAPTVAAGDAGGVGDLATNSSSGTGTPIALQIPESGRR